VAFRLRTGGGGARVPSSHGQMEPDRGGARQLPLNADLRSAGHISIKVSAVPAELKNTARGPLTCRRAEPPGVQFLEFLESDCIQAALGVQQVGVRAHSGGIRGRFCPAHKTCWGPGSQQPRPRCSLTCTELDLHGRIYTPPSLAVNINRGCCAWLDESACSDSMHWFAASKHCMDTRPLCTAWM
jgi:hypothetical protein